MNLLVKENLENSSYFIMRMNKNLEISFDIIKKHPNIKKLTDNN